MLGVLPFGHIYGLTVAIHQPLVVGVPVVVLPRFEGLSALKAIQRFKITWALVVPPILLLMLHSPNVAKFDISSLRGCMSGAAPLSADLQQAFERKYPSIAVTQGYGLTETSPVSHVMTVKESRGKYGLIGYPMPTFQARLVDEHGHDVSHGDRGEVWLRGPSVMKGYWRNEEATRNTFAEGRVVQDGRCGVGESGGAFRVGRPSPRLAAGSDRLVSLTESRSSSNTKASKVSDRSRRSSPG